ncbi:hypothetical protein EDB81DRAFT_795399 [Dactylonectria macrodidyma]|uniref:Zn(2)-C6 fungal-type domain-containing protein n=1 Tax=Dactylonectria macrodidyma TaxID=307937 RepID=A0A9P9EXU0_9HYPO|nr:hypothetical protein EDB81DRAFT_795399 [Dactylonectria macrodidyma]
MSGSRPAARRRGRACDECARRRIRCGPERPCLSCLQRGIARFCDVPAYTNNNLSSNSGSIGEPRPRIRAPMKEPVNADIAVLRERIADLEEQLARVQRRPDAVSDEQGYPPVLGVTYDIEELDYSMDHLNLGLAAGPHTSKQEVEPSLGPQNSLTRFTLPSRGTSTAIIHFVLEQLSWLHCALMASDFVIEHEKFWDTIETNQGQHRIPDNFATIYYATLSVGLFYIDTHHDTVLNFSFHGSANPKLAVPTSGEDLTTLSRYWYWAALQDLDDNDFLGTPKLSTIQVIAILTMVNSSFGQNSREWMLMAVAVNMARMFHMHRLGSEQTLSPSIAKLPQWRTIGKRNLGRRLWWTLVICDWMGVMSHRPAISPHSFDTILDPNSEPDDAIISSSFNESRKPPSSLHYHQLMAKLAGVLRTYVKNGRSYAPKNLIAAMHEVEQLDRESPEHLKRVMSLSERSSSLEAAFPWIELQRYLAVHAVQFIRLTIARFFFTRWMKRQPDPEGLHLKACQAAEIIVAEKMRPVSTMYRKSWIVCAATVAAGVFLCLDLLFFSTGEDVEQMRTRRESVQICIDHLRQMGSTNVVTQRGSVVLEALLEIQSTWPRTTVPDHDSLQRVIEQVIQAQRLGSEHEPRWTRPLPSDGKLSINDHLNQIDSQSWDPFITASPSQRLDLPTGFTPFEVDRSPSFREDSADEQLSTLAPEIAVSNPERAWDYLMGGNRPTPNEGQSENMDLEELEDFDNPFQFSETLYNMTN